MAESDTSKIILLTAHIAQLQALTEAITLTPEEIEAQDRADREQVDETIIKRERLEKDRNGNIFVKQHYSQPIQPTSSTDLNTNQSVVYPQTLLYPTASKV